MTAQNTRPATFTPMTAPAQPAPTGLYGDPALLAALMTVCRLSADCLTKEQSYLRTDAETDAFGDAWDAYLDLLASRMGHPGLLIRPGRWNKPQFKALMNAGLFGLSAECLRDYGARVRAGQPGEFACAFLTLDNRLQEVRQAFAE